MWSLAEFENLSVEEFKKKEGIVSKEESEVK